MKIFQFIILIYKAFTFLDSIKVSLDAILLKEHFKKTFEILLLLYFGSKFK